MADSFVRLMIIGAGGFFGAIMRYLVSGWAQGRSPAAFFPFGTMSVNMLGCFFIGFLTMLVELRAVFSVEMRSFIFIGFLGAFTTFSTFGNETFHLIREGRFMYGLINSGVQLTLGLFMVWLGRIIATFIWR